MKPRIYPVTYANFQGRVFFAVSLMPKPHHRYSALWAAAHKIKEAMNRQQEREYERKRIYRKHYREQLTLRKTT